MNNRKETFGDYLRSSKDVRELIIKMTSLVSNKSDIHLRHCLNGSSLVFSGDFKYTLISGRFRGAFRKDKIYLWSDHHIEIYIDIIFPGNKLYENYRSYRELHTKVCSAEGNVDNLLLAFTEENPAYCNIEECVQKIKDKRDLEISDIKEKALLKIVELKDQQRQLRLDFSTILKDSLGCATLKNSELAVLRELESDFEVTVDSWGGIIFLGHKE